jgi:hypothetical protein
MRGLFLVAPSRENTTAFGGGVSIEMDGRLELSEGATVQANKAPKGAGVHVTASMCLCEDCVFADNDAGSGRGAGIFATQSAQVLGVGGCEGV